MRVCVQGNNKYVLYGRYRSLEIGQEKFLSLTLLMIT